MITCKKAIGARLMGGGGQRERECINCCEQFIHDIDGISNIYLEATEVKIGTSSQHKIMKMWSIFKQFNQERELQEPPTFLGVENTLS